LTFLKNNSKKNYISGRIELMQMNYDEHYDMVDEETKQKWIRYADVLNKFHDNHYKNNVEFFFVAGSCMIFSDDMIHEIICKVIVDNCLDKANIASLPDDIVLSAILVCPELRQKDFKCIYEYLHVCSKLEGPSDYDKKIFFIRNRTDQIFGTRDIDLMNYINQVKHFYNYDFNEILQKIDCLFTE
jgi:hypothetical protein